MIVFDTDRFGLIGSRKLNPSPSTSTMSNNNEVGEIEPESTPLISSSDESRRSVKTKVPEAELHVYRQGKGPIEVFKVSLGGWDQDQLEVREILDRFGFKSLYAFSPGSGRGVPIRFNPRNGRSVLTYRDSAVIYVDGEPKVLLC